LTRRRVLIKNEKGISLIEVLIALAIMALVAVAFLSGLTTASKALIIADERTTAESLARSQVEYVKEQDYSTVQWSYEVSSSNRMPLGLGAPSWWDDDNPPLLSNNYDGYSVEVSAEDFDFDGDGMVEVPGEDEDIRKITVVVKHDAKEVFTFIEDDKKITLEDYKVNR